MKITNISEQFGDYLYYRLPKVYRDYDVAIDRPVEDSNGDIKIKRFYTLQQYLYSFADGGFKPLMEDLEAIISLIDPMQCPEQFLPILLQHFGLNFIEDIPIKFQRRLIQNIVMLYRKKGTIPAVAFLARELSGFDVTIEETERGGVEFALVKLSAYENEEAELLLAQDIVQRYIHLFLPSNTKAEVVVTYGFTEGIHINSSIPLEDYIEGDSMMSGVGLDHVKYNAYDDAPYHAGFIHEEYLNEHFDLLERCVEEDFAVIKSAYGYDELTLENYDFTPFDVSSFTNILDEGDFVYTNGICCEDLILEEAESSSGTAITHSTGFPSVRYLYLKSKEFVASCPSAICGCDLSVGDVVELRDETNNLGYFFESPINLYYDRDYPTHFVVDPYNKSVKVFSHIREYVIDGSYPCEAVDGYPSFKILDSSTIYMTKYLLETTGATPGEEGYYGGDNGKTYIKVSKEGIYVSDSSIKDADSMTLYLRNHPIHIKYVPYHFGLICFEKFLKDSPPKKPIASLSLVTDDFSFLTQPRRIFHSNVGFVIEDSSSNSVCVTLPITLCSMNGKSDFIEKKDGKYYIHHWIDYLSNLENFDYTRGLCIKDDFFSELDCYPVEDKQGEHWHFSMLPEYTENSISYGIGLWGDTGHLTVRTQQGSTLVLCSSNKPITENFFGRVVLSSDSLYPDYKSNIIRYFKEREDLSDIKPRIYYERKTSPRIEEITDKVLINKLNLLPIPDNYAKIYSKDIPFEELKLTVEGKNYY